ncbi:MAG TPA: PEP-utilizing enzyme, partial [Actinomycetota bacterium]
ELERAVTVPGYRPNVPLGPDRWEAFVSAVVAAEGDPFAACPVSSGSGCGPAHVLVAGAGRPGPRAVLVAKDPVPQIAPLLWGCAGLVTTSGSEAAHLFEVARSLGVPAVTTSGLSVHDLVGLDTFLSVDGDRGEISVMSHTGPVTRMAGVGA